MAGSPKSPVAPSEGAAQAPVAAQVVGGVATPPRNLDTNTVAAPDTVAFPLGAQVEPPVGSVEVVQASGAQFIGGYRLVEGTGISLTPYGAKGVQISNTQGAGALPGLPVNSVQYAKSATVFGGLTNIATPDGANLQVLDAGYIGLGTDTAVPATGLVRIPYNGGAVAVPIITLKGSVGDHDFLVWGPGDAVTVGDLDHTMSLLGLSVLIQSSLSGPITLKPQNTTAMVVTSTEIDVTVDTIVNQSQLHSKTTTKEYEAHANGAPSVNTSFAIPSTSGCTLDVEVTAINSTGTVQGTFKSTIQYASAGGVITDGTQIDVQKTFIGGPPAWTLTLDHAGSNTRITFNPIADNVSIYVVAAFKQITPIP